MGAKTVVLSGREYSLHTMPPVRACVFSAKVAKLIASALGNVGELINAKDKDMAAMRAISEGVEGIDAEQYDLLAKQAVAYASCELGKLSSPSVFDDWFTQHPGDMHKVCVWAIWQHASPFLITEPEDWVQVMPTQA